MNCLRALVCPYLHSARIIPLYYPFLISKQWVSYLGKWEEPSGYDTGIAVYNSTVNQKVPLILQRKDVVTWYMCGPTVYAESHIGHASCYVRFDIIRRILENIFNLNVVCLLGITDIDDKIINKAKMIGMDIFELSKKYELDFFGDMESLRVLPPSAVVRVTENIPVIISFCKNLIEKEFAYATPEGNVYFVVSKGATAEVLHEMPQELLHSHTDPSKRDPRDFVLWKAAKPNQPYWESPWGRGRPGWHIECSAMASKIFGSELDLHSGGYDLLFPHHANEKSQSEAYHNCRQWVNYWLHAGLLQVGDEMKMSKSLNNTISVKEFLEEHTVNDFRIFCLQFLYRKNISYSSETMSGAKSLHNKLHNFINECELYISGETRGPVVNRNDLLAKLATTKEQVTSLFGNDFNTSQALLSLTQLVDEINKSLQHLDPSSPVSPEGIVTIFSCYSYVNRILEVLGISIISKKKLSGEIVFSLDAAVELRNKIRKFALNPNDIDLGKEDTFSDYANSSYKIFKQKIEMSLSSKENSSYLCKISQASKEFYNEVLSFAKSLDSEKGMQLLKQMTLKNARQKTKPLFAICDNFRSDLLISGIAIKDQGANSLWIPLITFDKILFHKPFRY